MYYLPFEITSRQFSNCYNFYKQGLQHSDRANLLQVVLRKNDAINYYKSYTNHQYTSIISTTI